MVFNHLAIITLALFHFILGLVWFSPLLFGEERNEELSISKKDQQKMIKKGTAKMLLIGFIPSLVMAYVLAYFIALTAAQTFLAGARVGLLAGIGFVATIAFSGVLWEKSTVKGYLINISYYLIALSIMGGVLAVWKL